MGIAKANIERGCKRVCARGNFLCRLWHERICKPLIDTASKPIGNAYTIGTILVVARKELKETERHPYAIELDAENAGRRDIAEYKPNMSSGFGIVSRQPFVDLSMCKS